MLPTTSEFYSNLLVSAQRKWVTCIFFLGHLHFFSWVTCIFELQVFYRLTTTQMSQLKRYTGVIKPTGEVVVIKVNRYFSFEFFNYWGQFHQNSQQSFCNIISRRFFLIFMRLRKLIQGQMYVSNNPNKIFVRKMMGHKYLIKYLHSKYTFLL